MTSVVRSRSAVARAALRVAAHAAVVVLLGGVLRQHWWLGLLVLGLVALAAGGADAAPRCRQDCRRAGLGCRA